MGTTKLEEPKGQETQNICSNQNLTERLCPFPLSSEHFQSPNV